MSQIFLLCYGLTFLFLIVTLLTSTPFVPTTSGWLARTPPTLFQVAPRPLWPRVFHTSLILPYYVLPSTYTSLLHMWLPLSLPLLTFLPTHNLQMHHSMDGPCYSTL